MNFCQNHNANTGGAVHTLSQEATDMQKEAREKVARFINAADSVIVFVRDTTEAINLVAYSLGLHTLKKVDEILISVSHQSCEIKKGRTKNTSRHLNALSRLSVGKGDAPLLVDSKHILGFC